MSMNFYARGILCLGLSLATGASLRAQLTGTITIPNGTYANLGAVVTALNSQGVGTGGVVINITAGNTQYAPAGGYQLGSAALNGSVSSAKTITINGNNNTIISPVGTSTTTDGILLLKGTDYVTLNGLSLSDTNTVSPTTQMEWGIALLKLNGTAPFDGCQHVTVSNCTITLKRTNTASVGIYAGNHTAAGTTVLTITTAADAASSNVFTGNTIQNVGTGISLNGYNAPAGSYALYDQNNTIGSSLSSQGNTIRNFSNAATTAATTYGIYLNNQHNAVVQNNTVDNVAGGGSPNKAGSFYGIYHATGVGSSVTISGNHVSVTQDSVTNMTAFTAIRSDAGGGTGARCVITDNTITAIGGKGGGQCNLIQNTGGLYYELISGNRFHNIELHSLGAINFINNANTALPGGTMIIRNNALSGSFVFKGLGISIQLPGTISCISNTGSSPAGVTDTIMDNDFSGLLMDSATNKRVNGISDLNGTAGSGPFKYIRNNTFRGCSGTNLFGITVSNPGKLGAAPSVIADNVISRVQRLSTGIQVNAVAGQAADISGNRIDSALNDNTVSPNVIGISIAGGDAISVYRNMVRNIDVPDAATLKGIYVADGAKVSVYNNIVAGLTASAANTDTAIAGIYLAGGDTISLYHNTVHLNPVNTVGLSFGVSGLYFQDTVGQLDMRNNIFYVDAVPAGDGIVAAVRRNTGTAGTPPANVAPASNGNIYYAPDATSSYLYAEGGNAFSTANIFNLTNDPDFNRPCGVYKAFMVPRDSSSFTERNLQAGATGLYAPAGASYAKGLAVPTAAPQVTTDYTGATRPANADIGALQFTGTAKDVLPPAITLTPLPASVCTAPPALQATITDNAMVDVSADSRPRLYYRKQSDDDAFGNYPADNVAAFNGWKYTEATGAAPNFTFVPDYTRLTGGMVAGDSIVYFVAAQDTGTHNVSFKGAIPAAGYCPQGVNLTAGAAPLAAGSSLYGYRVKGVMAVTMPSHDTAVCAGYQLTAAAAPGAAYQWQQGGAAISGATTASYTVATDGSYRVIVVSDGCADTSAAISLTVHPLPDPVIIMAGGMLSTGTFASYQWNNSNGPINGATTQTYMPTADGDYTVTVTDANGCSNTSAAQHVAVGVAGIAPAAAVQLYPNPAGTVVYIAAPVPVRVTVCDMSGKTMLQSGGSNRIDIGGLADGMYIVKITDGKGVVLKHERLVKKSR